MSGAARIDASAARTEASEAPAVVAAGDDIEVDVAVVGAGAAGLYAAICAARAGGRVALVSATSLAPTASYWAQGGPAAPLAADDSPALHCHRPRGPGRR